MKQMSLDVSGFARKAKRTRKRQRLDKSTPMGALMDKLEQVRRASGPRSNTLLGDQAPIRASEGALSGLGQEHGSNFTTVCAVQSVDGEAHVAAADAGMSTPAGAQRGAKQGAIGLETGLQS